MTVSLTGRVGLTWFDPPSPQLLRRGEPASTQMDEGGLTIKE
jgi:hypothetical protein